MFFLQNFEYDIKNNLTKFSNTFINKLNNISQLKFNTEVDLIDFVIFIEPTRFEVDIMMFSMDKEGNQVFNERKSQDYFADSIEIISELQFYFDESILENEEFLEKADEIVTKVIIDWFTSCREQSTCENIKLPVFVSVDDCLESYDLKKHKWIQIKEKYI